jgi:hypothetical protein
MGINMSWEDVLKSYLTNAHKFSMDMKTAQMTTMKLFQEFDEKNPEIRTDIKVEMQDLGTAIIDLGEAIQNFDRLLKRQEELQ